MKATPSMIASALLVVLATAGLVLAEKSGARWLTWVSKPLASTGFVSLALCAGGLTTPYGRGVMLALALGWLGDVLLLGRGSGAFVLGLASFLFGHAAFGAAFAARGIAWPVAVCAALALVAPARSLWRWLMPAVPTKLRDPVGVYLGVILVMVALSIGTAWCRGSWLIPVAAVMFAVSDVSVARDRFMHAGFVNKAWGLPLYYAAQCLLALTTAASG